MIRHVATEFGHRYLRDFQRDQLRTADDVDMATWALARCLQHSAVTCVIPGCKNVEQVEANARAAELDLVRDDHPHPLTGASATTPSLVHTATPPATDAPDARMMRAARTKVHRGA